MSIVRGDTLIDNTVSQINVVVSAPWSSRREQYYICLKYNIFHSGGLAVWDFEYLAVFPSGYLWASYRVYKIGYLLVRGIPLPAK